MPEREKVIRGLEFHKKVWDNALFYRCENEFGIRCPYEECRPGCTRALAVDALALLNEQEPRVMTWDELMRCADGDPAFIEARDRSCCWVLVRPTYIGMIGKNGYGVRWRYWTSRPSPNQMRDTPWDPPKEEDDA